MSGPSRSTLLYYEACGVLRPSRRSEAAHRLYDESCGEIRDRSVARHPRNGSRVFPFMMVLSIAAAASGYALQR